MMSSFRDRKWSTLTNQAMREWNVQIALPG